MPAKREINKKVLGGIGQVTSPNPPSVRRKAAAAPTAALAGIGRKNRHEILHSSIAKRDDYS